MSCNYYIRTKDLDMAFDLMPRVKMLKEEREFEIHLCQTVNNSTPLYEVHSYNNFKELKDILLNENYIFRIENEYGDEYGVEEFIEMITNDNKNSAPRRGKYPEFLLEKKFHVDEDGIEWLDCDLS